MGQLEKDLRPTENTNGRGRKEKENGRLGGARKRGVKVDRKKGEIITNDDAT